MLASIRQWTHVPLFDVCVVGVHASQAGCMQVLASVLFLRLHPKPLKHTPSYEFSASFLGVCSGIVVAVSRMAQRYKQAQPGGFMHMLRLANGWQVVLRMMLGEEACCHG